MSAREETTTSSLRDLRLRELRRIARELGIRRYSTLHHRALVDRIEMERRPNGRRDEPAIPSTRLELSEMSVAALKEICRRLRVVHYYRMNKVTLIDCVLNARRREADEMREESVAMETRPEPIIREEDDFLSVIDLFDEEEDQTRDQARDQARNVAELLPALAVTEEPPRRVITVQFNVLRRRRTLYETDFVLLPILTEHSTLPANHEFYFVWNRSVHHFNDFLHGACDEFFLSPHVRVTQDASGLVRFSYVGTQSYATVTEDDCESLWTLLLSRPRTEGAIVVGRNYRTSRLRIANSVQRFVDAYSRIGVGLDSYDPNYNPSNDAAPTEDDMKIDDDLDEKIACSVCLIRRKTHAFVPCGHYAYCYLCARHPDISKCVVCRRPVNGCLKIYDS